MARELGPSGITVNMVAPGWIPVDRHAESAPEELAAYLAEVPLGRMGSPDDVAGVVAFLASDAAALSSPVSGSPSTAATRSTELMPCQPC